jgi:cytochrome c biogenesis protein CcdA
MPDLPLALLAGILTIAAPCTLPVLPILLGASIGRRAGRGLLSLQQALSRRLPLSRLR